MQIPLLSTLRELDREPRKFLMFTVFNLASWQCIVGPALILFARKLEMPAAWVGILISFMPLSMLTVAFTIPLVTRVGPKRLMLLTWALRLVVASAVFSLPWVLSTWGERAAWYGLLAVTLGFCLSRAIGVGGWYPWLHEVVPPGQRGYYFSAETASTQLVNVLLGLGLALILRGEPGIGRFLAVYAVGIASGLISLFYMSRVSGGHGVKEAIPLAHHFGSYKVAFRERAFLAFVGTGTLCMSCLTWLSASQVLYMRDGLELSSWMIMALTSLGSAGVLMTIHSWARYAEHSGSGRTMALTLTAHSLAALLFIAVLPGAQWSVALLALALAVATVFNSAFMMAANRAMLNFVKVPGRVGFTNLWTVGIALSCGLTPIGAGFAIGHWGLTGFRVCFLAAGVAGLLCAFAIHWCVRDGNGIEKPLSQLISPALPIRTLARIAWVTAGMHESSQARRAADGK